MFASYEMELYLEQECYQKDACLQLLDPVTQVKRSVYQIDPSFWRGLLSIYVLLMIVLSMSLQDQGLMVSHMLFFSPRDLLDFETAIHISELLSEGPMLSTEAPASITQTARSDGPLIKDFPNFMECS